MLPCWKYCLLNFRPKELRNNIILWVAKFIAVFWIINLVSLLQLQGKRQRVVLLLCVHGSNYLDVILHVCLQNTRCHKIRLAVGSLTFMTIMFLSPRSTWGVHDLNWWYSFRGDLAKVLMDLTYPILDVITHTHIWKPWKAMSRFYFGRP